MVSATSDTAWIVRKQAIISLKYFYSKKAEQQLRKLAKDEDPKNQILAIESLYLSQKDDQLSTVLQFLKSDDPTIRNLAAQTFSFVSENRFLTALKGALEDETDPRVIMELEKAITFIEQSR
ncbi:MAG: HEAT repeat domain-containing protein [Candidatus Marinimicrobia bacterium]|nr:HEAT repeat domain-containing protein [Candidatus Neomarinimicrobiota bacterium]